MTRALTFAPFFFLVVFSLGVGRLLCCRVVAVLVWSLVLVFCFLAVLVFALLLRCSSSSSCPRLLAPFPRHAAVIVVPGPSLHVVFGASPVLSCVHYTQHVEFFVFCCHVLKQSPLEALKE